MRNRKIIDSYNRIQMDASAQERIWKELTAGSEEFLPEMEDHMKAHQHKKLWKTLLIAAVLTALLASTAYAADLLGIRAMLRPSETVDVGEQSFDTVSLTQPQQLPEEIDIGISEKIAASQAAWEEWSAYKQENEADALFFAPPEEASASQVEENQDGTVTFTYYKTVEVDENGNFSGEILETRTGTREQYEAYLEYCDVRATGYGRYDFNYGVYSSEAEAKLEEIAAKYSLNLREAGTVYLEATEDYSAPNALSKEELAEVLTEAACSGNLFRRMPDLFDKLYTYNEGSFGVAFNQSLPDGNTVHCYCCNFMYSTLSSGREVVEWLDKSSSLSTHSFTAADGTALTVINAGEAAFIYTFLDDSYFTMRIDGGGTPLSDEDIDSIADMLDYSVIGK